MKKTKKELPKYLENHVKAYGNIICSGVDVLSEKKNYKVLSIGPILDIALGGGVKEGS